jgi:hypothetical protein
MVRELHREKREGPIVAFSATVVEKLISKIAKDLHTVKSFLHENRSSL